MDNLRQPWPFGGRGEELDLVRRNLSAGRRGIVVTGASGSGKTRLGAEAVRGLEHALVTGTRAARPMPFAAFAHVLPGTVSLHRAAHVLRDVRVLVVDDAHLLDDSSAALIHLMAVHGRTRLLILARPDGGAPDAVSRLWTADLVPSLTLTPLSPDASARLIEVVLGGDVDALRRTAAGTSRRCRSSAPTEPGSPDCGARSARPSPGAARDCAAVRITPPVWPSWLTPPPVSAICERHGRPCPDTLRPGKARTWLLAAEGDIDGARRSLAGDGAFELHDAVRLGAPGLVLDRLGALSGELAALLTSHAAALVSRDGKALDGVAHRLEERGLLVHSAEASAQAALAHRDRRAAQAARNRAATLAHRCAGVRTPALADVTLGELTARQRQIAQLAAAGLTNRQIAEQLSLSVRTVGNHLYGAYSRLGSNDRAGLGALA